MPLLEAITIRGTLVELPVRNVQFVFYICGFDTVDSPNSWLTIVRGQLGLC